MKRLLSGLAVSLFTFGLSALLVSSAFVLTFGTSDTLKDTLKKNDIYAQFIDSVFTSIEQEQGTDEGAQPSEDDISLNHEVIRTSAEQAFPPSLLESSAENIIDGTYHWLAGESAEPSFRVDLSGAKQTLATTLADQALNRLVSLPVCTAEQLQTIDLSAIDPFALPCQPPGLDLQAERNRYFNEVVNTKDFLEDPVITAETFRSEDGQSPFDSTDGLPRAFQSLRRLPWIFGVLVVAMGSIVVWLHQDRRRAFSTLARIALIVGSIFLVISAVAAFAFGKINIEGEGAAEIQNLLASVLLDLIAAMNRTLIMLSALAAALGGGGLAALHFTKPKGENSKGEKPSEQKHTPSTDKTEK